MTKETHNKYLQPTAYFDFETPAFQAFVETAIGDVSTPKEKAIRIYYAVRDRWLYYPYDINFTKKGLQASAILNKDYGHCIDKSILMIAALRKVGIPARLGLAKVKNHIAAEKFTKVLGTDELVPHGYVDLFLDGQWIKATPAFNKKLCELLKVNPLEFDGETDSLFQQFNEEGSSFMEYLADFGAFEDVPLPYMIQLMKETYTLFVDSNSYFGGDLKVQLEE